MQRSTNSSGAEHSAVRTGLLLFVAAWVARLVPVLLARDLGIGLDDMFQYDMLARSLAAGDGFRWYAPPDLERMLTALETYAGIDPSSLTLPEDPRGVRASYRAPLYPAFLALIYRLVPESSRFFAARLVQAPLLASLAPLAYLLARRLRADERWARAAGWTAALWPMLVAMPLALATENLFIPLVTFGLLTLLWAEEQRPARRYLLPGLLFGLATLTRSISVGFAGLAALWAWWRGRRHAAIALLLPVLLLTIPWSVRNTLLHDQLTFVESNLGTNLYLGYHPESDGTFKFGPSLDLITIFDDAERNRVGQQLAWEFIQDDPGRIPGLMLSKLGHFWGLEDRAFMYLYSNGLLGPLPPAVVVGLYSLLVLPLVLVLPLAILGWIVPPRSRPWRLITLLFAWYIGVHLLIIAEARYHVVLVPVLVGLAARGLSLVPAWLQRFRAGDRRSRWLAAAAVGLICLAFANWGLELYGQADRLAILFSPEGWQAGFHY